MCLRLKNKVENYAIKPPKILGLGEYSIVGYWI
jgi:hypothetical protein